MNATIKTITILTALTFAACLPSGGDGPVDYDESSSPRWRVFDRYGFEVGAEVGDVDAFTFEEMRDEIAVPRSLRTGGVEQVRLLEPVLLFDSLDCSGIAYGGERGAHAVMRATARGFERHGAHAWIARDIVEGIEPGSMWAHGRCTDVAPDVDAYRLDLVADDDFAEGPYVARFR